MKKLMMLMFCIVFLAPTLSAIEWDNYKDYDEQTQTLTVRNGLTFGTKIADITLTTDLINRVPVGYQKVAEFQINSYVNYGNAFKELELFDKTKRDLKFTRDFDFKVLGYENVSVPNYVEECSKVWNGTECSMIESGTKIVEQETWTNLALADFNKDDDLTIGIFTVVEKGDVVEWIPNFFGVRIDEWAVWTASLNVDLVLYYNLNATSGTVVDVSGGGHNATNNGATRGVTGIIENAFDWDGSDDWVDTAVNDFTTGNSWSVSMCFKGTDTTNLNYLWDVAGADRNIIRTDGGFLRMNYNDNTQNINFATNAVAMNGTFNCVLFTTNGTLGAGYFNGLSSANVSVGTATYSTTSGAVLGAIRPVGASNRFNGTIDEIGVWNRTLTPAEAIQLWNNGLALTWTDEFGPEITLNAPVDQFNTTNQIVTFNTTVTDDTGVINVSLFINGVLAQTNSSGVNGTYIFVETLNVGTNIWSIGAVDDADLPINSSNRTVNVLNFTEIGSNFNLSASETDTQTYITNISLRNGLTPTDAIFFYNGTNEGSATITNIAGDNFSFSKTIDVPLLGGNNGSFLYSFTINSIGVNTSGESQSVNTINFTECTGSVTTTFLNITFKNETTNQEDITATLSSSFVYYLGTGEVNKTYTFANSTENINYDFCFNDSTRTLNLVPSVQFSNSESQARNWNPTLLSLTNATTTQVLYLLPTGLGLFSQFRTQTNFGQTITDVRGLITRTLGGSTITVAIDFTDGSGLSVYFLNPDVTYTALFSKIGFLDNTFTFVPITDLRTVTMGQISTTGNGSEISLNTTYVIAPINSSLNNNTDITFSLNVTSSQAITFISLNISNSTDSGLLIVNNSGQGFISGVLNTGNNTKLFGEFAIHTANESILIYKVWVIGPTFIGDYSLFNQMVLFNDYGFNDFFRILIVMLILSGIMILMSTANADEEIKMLVAILIVWAFSIVSWLDTGLVTASGNNTINALTQFSSQYGIAIISSSVAAYFIGRRMFRQI